MCHLKRENFFSLTQCYGKGTQAKKQKLQNRALYSEKQETRSERERERSMESRTHSI